MILYGLGAILIVLLAWYLGPVGVAVIGIIAFAIWDFGIVSYGPGGVALNIPVPGGAVEKVKLAADEVFLVNNQQFTAKDAEPVCAAYGARVATIDDIDAAYRSGASWNNYGWSSPEGMAFFPMNEEEWLKHKDDPAYGRPGVNGGRFDPNMKFGVNCFGKKPAATQGELDALYAGMKKPEDRRKKAAFDRIKDEVLNFKLSPWDDDEWSRFAKPVESEGVVTGHQSILKPLINKIKSTLQ